MNIPNLGERSILILGFGIEGQASYTYLRRTYPQATIGIADKRIEGELPLSMDVEKSIALDQRLQLHLGEGYERVISTYDVVVKSPGIPYRHPAVVEAVKAGRLVTSHIALFFEAVNREQTIGVTGTKGKSTTASLIHHVLREAGLDSRLTGNIGVPPLQVSESSNPTTRFVVELSSYQLDQIRVSPHIAVLLNIVPEHLGLHDTTACTPHHVTFDEYASAKENITRFQSGDDIFVFNSDFPIPSEIASRTKAALRPFSTSRRLSVGSWIENGIVRSHDGKREETIMPVSEIPLLGSFNIQNVLAAVSVALELRATSESIRRAVRTTVGRCAAGVH